MSEASLVELWKAEALRVYTRYQIEIVEACGFCPWARRARLDGVVRADVLFDGVKDVAASLDAITALTTDRRVEVAVLLFPNEALDWTDFDRSVSQLRDAEAKRHDLGAIPFVLAAFHPSAPLDTENAERLIPFLRRTPDPSIQLVRASSLERIHEHAPSGTQYLDLSSPDATVLANAAVVPVRERIARANFATAMRIGIPELVARLDDIRRDRNEAYGRLCMRKVGDEP